MKTPPRPTFAMVAFLAATLLVTPVYAESRKASEQAGAILFRDKGCAYCHGATAQGTGRGPSLNNLRKTWKAPQIADQIENGGQKMPSFKESVSPQELAQLVAFLRAKHRPGSTPAAGHSTP